MVEKRVLPNGARVLIEEIPYVRSAAIGVFVNVGSKHEPAELNGISHFIEHMLFKGTATRSARAIAEEFEKMGGQLNAYTSKEHTCFYARILDENLNEAMDVLFDMLYNSAMTQKDVDTERGVILEEINMYEDSPDELIHDVFSQTIMGGHPLGRPILGHEEIIASLSRDSINDYYRSFYHPANMVIAVVGNIKGEEVFARLAGYKGYRPNPGVIKEALVPNLIKGVNLVPKDTEQVQICLGVPGIPYTDERRYTQNVMNSILGGGISSHLFQKIREEKGLAYNVFSYPSTYRETGTYAIYVGTGPGKVREFFALLRDELDRFISEGVTAEEVMRTQSQIKASLFLGMESVMARMNRLGKSELLYGKVTPVEEVIERVFAVTPQMVQDYAREILGKHPYTLAVIGEPSVLPEVENGFHELDVLVRP
ncbi:MAG: M16 family metallopeptidase [Syntrophomonadales bacterium]